jgi:transcriptional regulator GlxA family with amidase domain
MEYLRDYRLELAREELEKAAITGRTVTEIALNCGFNHPGKFAKCYRERFGESPSQTRRK